MAPACDIPWRRDEKGRPQTAGSRPQGRHVSTTSVLGADEAAKEKDEMTAKVIFANTSEKWRLGWKQRKDEEMGRKGI